MKSIQVSISIFSKEPMIIEIEYEARKYHLSALMVVNQFSSIIYWLMMVLSIS